jgi:ribosomal-protein-alanine N-acetyltransferase
VHRYLGNNPIQTLQQASEVIEFVRRQYDELGVGRLAVIEKASGSFVGWSGLKKITEEVLGKVDFHDLGYRLVRKHWGKGYATESAVASLKLGFGQMELDEIWAEADVLNLASNRVLQKVGMVFRQEFIHYDRPHNVYHISREQWEKQYRPS